MQEPESRKIQALALKVQISFVIFLSRDFIAASSLLNF